MQHHEVIEIFSPLWWKFLSATVITVAVLIFLGKKIPAAKEIIRKICGALLVAVSILLHVYLIYLVKWNLHTSLPLQVCSLSGILSGVVLLWHNQFTYELLLYWGIPGAFYSLLTPEMTQGSGTVFIYEYYISHGGIIFSALYLSMVYGMCPRKYSWLRIFLFSQLLLPVAGTADYFLNANYMYLRAKPEVQNIFFAGDWPWYILVLDAVMLFHFIIVYLAFKLKRAKK